VTELLLVSILVGLQTRLCLSCQLAQVSFVGVAVVVVVVVVAVVVVACFLVVLWVLIWSNPL